MKENGEIGFIAKHLLGITIKPAWVKGAYEIEKKKKKVKSTAAKQKLTLKKFTDSINTRTNKNGQNQFL